MPSAILVRTPARSVVALMVVLGATTADDHLTTQFLIIHGSGIYRPAQVGGFIVIYRDVHSAIELIVLLFMKHSILTSDHSDELLSLIMLTPASPHRDTQWGERICLERQQRVCQVRHPQKIRQIQLLRARWCLVQEVWRWQQHRFRAHVV